MALDLTYFVELDDVWVANFFENFDFSRNPVDVFSVFDSSFFEDFDRDALFGQNVLSHLHLAERAFPQRFACDKDKEHPDMMAVEKMSQ